MIRGIRTVEGRRLTTHLGPLAAALLLGLACAPTVKVAPPDEPITINLNVKIEHEIKVQVDKELEEAFESDSGIF